MRAILARGPKEMLPVGIRLCHPLKDPGDGPDGESFRRFDGARQAGAAARQILLSGSQADGFLNLGLGPPHTLQALDRFLLDDVGLLDRLPAPGATLRKLKEFDPGPGGEPADNDDQDGPFALYGFRHNGQIYDHPPLARSPFLALSAAWKSKRRCVNQEDLAEALYKDREEGLNESTLRNLQRGINDFFSVPDKIPYKATCPQVSIAIKDWLKSARSEVR